MSRKRVKSPRGVLVGRWSNPSHERGSTPSCRRPEASPHDASPHLPSPAYRHAGPCAARRSHCARRVHAAAGAARRAADRGPVRPRRAAAVDRHALMDGADQLDQRLDRPRRHPRRGPARRPRRPGRLPQGVRQPLDRAAAVADDARHDLRPGVAVQADRLRDLDHDPGRARARSTSTSRSRKYLPGFAQNGKEEITVEQLLLHRGGLIPDNPHRRITRTGPPRRAKRIDALKPQWQPGTHFAYSDVGFIVLGKLVQAVDGRPLDAVRAGGNLRARCGMTDTAYHPPEELAGRGAPRRRSARATGCSARFTTRARCALGGVAGHAGPVQHGRRPGRASAG